MGNRCSILRWLSNRIVQREIGRRGTIDVQQRFQIDPDEVIPLGPQAFAQSFAGTLFKTRSGILWTVACWLTPSADSSNADIPVASDQVRV